MSGKMEGVRKWAARLFCRHNWSRQRTPIGLKETDEICGVAVRSDCAKCGAERFRIAVL